LRIGARGGHGVRRGRDRGGIRCLARPPVRRVVEAHDGDYERFVVTGDLVIVESSRRGTVARLTFNREWARLVCVVQGRRCRLAVRSHGKEFPFGRLMSDADRMEWAQTVRGAIRVVNG
jgi:uncharacterized membrane protein